jgi:hypothetical protein
LPSEKIREKKTHRSRKQQTRSTASIKRAFLPSKETKTRSYMLRSEGILLSSKLMITWL